MHSTVFIYWYYAVKWTKMKRSYLKETFFLNVWAIRNFYCCLLFIIIRLLPSSCQPLCVDRIMSGCDSSALRRHTILWWWPLMICHFRESDVGINNSALIPLLKSIVLTSLVVSASTALLILQINFSQSCRVSVW